MGELAGGGIVGPGGCPHSRQLVNSRPVTGLWGPVITQARGSPAARGARGHTHTPLHLPTYPHPPSVSMCAHGASGGRAPEMWGRAGWDDSCFMRLLLSLVAATRGTFIVLRRDLMNER